MSEKMIDCLRNAMDKAEIPSEFRAPLIGYFCNAMNSISPLSDAQKKEGEAVAEFMGRRRTPEGTTEFWGVMLCDPMQDPPKGTKLYVSAPASAAEAPAVLDTIRAVCAKHGFQSRDLADDLAAALATPTDSAEPSLDECDCGYGCPPGCGCRHSGESPDSAVNAGAVPSDAQIVEALRNEMTLYDEGATVTDKATLIRAVRSAVANTSEVLHAFLDAAAGEGLVLGGVDAADLYVAIFPERYAKAIAGLDAGVAPKADSSEPRATSGERDQ